MNGTVIKNAPCDSKTINRRKKSWDGRMPDAEMCPAFFLIGIYFTCAEKSVSRLQGGSGQWKRKNRRDLCQAGSDGNSCG